MSSGRNSFLAILLFTTSFLSLYADGCQIPPLTFDEAVFRVFSRSPRLRMSSAEIFNKEGERLQSRLFPNPEFACSVENVLGNKQWKGWRDAESRYEVAQLIELGGKRGYRNSAADYEYFASQAGYEEDWIRLLNELMKAFASVAAAQEQLRLAEEQKFIGEQVLKTVSAKVDAGKASLIQQNKAEIALAQVEISWQRAKSNLESAREQLSLLWGSSFPDFDSVEYPFYEIESPKPLGCYLAFLNNNPELQRSEYEYLAANQMLNFEKAQRVPNVVVVVGCKTERKNTGATFGLVLPLPFFDQNQGNIQRARADTSKALDQKIQTQLLLESKLSIAHKQLLNAYQESERLASTVLKSAMRSFDYAKEGYNEGKFEYLDMLDSQRTLFDVQQDYIDVLLNYHRRRADLEYLSSEAE